MNGRELISLYDAMVDEFSYIANTCQDDVRFEGPLCKIDIHFGEGVAILVGPSNTIGWDSRVGLVTFEFPVALLDASPEERKNWADEQRNANALRESMVDKERKRADKEDRRRMFNELKQEFGSES